MRHRVDHASSGSRAARRGIQTDNGSEFQAAFQWHVLDKGIGHVYIKPNRPRLNGEVERDDVPTIVDFETALH
jgi:transposase InsO family protein